MKPINRLVITNLRQNKKRTRATLIAIILTCSLLFTFGFVFSSYQHYNQENAGKLYGSYHALYYDVNYENTINYFNKNKNVKDIYTLNELDEFEYGGVYTNKVLSYEELNKEIEITGEEPTNEKEILVSKYLLQRCNLKLGDEINAYKIVGTYNNYFADDYFGGNTYYYEGNKKIEFLLTKKEFDKSSEHSYLFVTYKSVLKSDKIMASDRKKLNLPPQGIRANWDYIKTYGVGQDNGMYVIYYCMFAFVLAIFSIFCMLIIYNAFAISLEMRKKQFGILRSLGVQKKKIIEMISKEIFILAIIAIPFSFIIASVIVSVGLSVINNLNDLNISMSYDSLTLLITVFFIIFSMVISAYTPGSKASKTSPIEAIRSESEYKIKMSNKKYPLTKRIFGEEGVLARKNLKRNGKKFGAVVTSLTVSLILFILTSTIVSVVIPSDSNIDNEYSNLIELQISAEPEYESDILRINNELKNSEYVNEIYIIKNVNSFIDVNKSSIKEEQKEEISPYFTFYIINEEAYKKILENNNLQKDVLLFYNKLRIQSIYDENDNLISTKDIEPFLDNPTITFCTDYESEECEFTIDNITTITNGIPYRGFVVHYYIIATEEMYNELKKDYHEYFITYEDKLALADYYIESDKFKEFDSYIASLELSYPNLNINCMNLALEFYNLKRQALSIKIIFYSIIIFLGTISISGMVNSINTNLNLRKREFAMLRSMGVSKKSLNKMIILENVFLVLKSFISSTIIVITGYILLNILFNFDSKALKIITPIKFYFKFPWFYSLIAFITVVAIILFLTRFSINKIKKQNIIDAIREYSI